MSRPWNSAAVWNTSEHWNGNVAPVFVPFQKSPPRVLVEIDTPIGPLWFADGRYVDAAAGIVAKARLGKRVGFDRRASLAYHSASGRAVQGIDSVELINTDGRLDYLLTLALRDRVLRVWMGTEATPIADLRLCARGIVETIQALGEVAIRLVVADATRELEVPLVTDAFSSGPLEGQLKPALFGIGYSIPAVQPEAPLLRFSVHDGAGLGGVLQVTDSGAVLTPTTQWEDYNTDPTFGVELNQATAGKILIDALGPGDGIGGERAQLPSLIAHLLGTRRGWSSDRWDTDWLTALNVELSEPEMGRWVADGGSVDSILDEIADSIGGWWTINPDGRFHIDTLRLPTGTPALVIDRTRLAGKLQVELDTAPGLSDAVLGMRNVFPLDAGQQAGSVRDTPAGVLLAQPFRARSTFAIADTYARSRAANSANREGQRFPGMPTLLANSASVANEAARREPLWAEARWSRRVPVLLDAIEAATLPLGTEVRLQHPRYEMQDGVDVIVLGVRGEFGARRVELLVTGFGPEPEEF